VEVQSGDTQFTHRFDVFDMAKNIHCVFGLDVFKKAGLAITGLPMSFPDTNQQQNAPPKNHPPPSTIPVDVSNMPLSKLIDQLNSNKESPIYSSLLLSYRKRLIDSKRIELELNAKIKGFCNLPSAVIPLDTGSHTPSNVRQYRVPHS
jgi:hypothetical protein